MVYYFVQKGFNLDLNIVNMIFLFLGILLHGDLRRYVDAIADAASRENQRHSAPVPFYAGIMGLMMNKWGLRHMLAGIIANFFTQISDNVAFPVLTFLSAGIINFFVPSGGGQWAVQAPIVMPAATEMGIEYGPGRHGHCLGRPVDQHERAILGLARSGDCRIVCPQYHGLSGHHYDAYWPGRLRRIPALGTPVLGIKLSVTGGAAELCEGLGA